MFAFNKRVSPSLFDEPPTSISSIVQTDTNDRKTKNVPLGSQHVLNNPPFEIPFSINNAFNLFLDDDNYDNKQESVTPYYLKEFSLIINSTTSKF